MNLKSKFQFFRKYNFTYLDSSATTQTPDKVVRVTQNSLEYKGNPHRGSHIIAQKNEEAISRARKNIARFINTDDKSIVFTNNTTDSINLAIDSIAHIINPGDEIITSVAEHHSNLLPFNKLLKKGAILKTVNIDKNGIVDIKELKNKISKKTRIVSIQHCSNVLGNINPIEKIGTLIKKFSQDIIFMVDAAQSIAHIPVDVEKFKCDFAFFSGHKMYGPDGVGVLYVSKKIVPYLEMTRLGGGGVEDVAIIKDSGNEALIFDTKNSLFFLEGGTPNVSNIIGLSEAVNFIRSIGFEDIRNHEMELTKKLVEKLKKIKGLIIYGPEDLTKKIGVVSFSIKDEVISDLGFYLDKRKICTRYGSHCAFPLSHKLGSETLRISLACYNDMEDIEKVVQEIKFYLDKKKGLIKNKNLEYIRDQVYYKNLIPFNKKSEIFNTVFSSINNIEETEVVILAGHFLAIPDKKSNSFYPSIKPLLPVHLNSLLDDFGMTTFPLFTWKLGCELTQFLKNKNVKTKLMLAANDTTGINELKDSIVNKDNKTAQDYREEFLSRFGRNDIHEIYKEILIKYNLTLDDLLKFEKDYYTHESILRSRFYKFIKANSDYFNEMIDYTANKKGSLDLSIKVLDNQEVKTCKINTFNSKMGGQFCVIEVVQLLGELFGLAENINFKNISKILSNPKIRSKNKIFIMLSPAMCNNAITAGGELYSKLFLRDQDLGSFKFFNIPFGPDSEKSLAIGTDCSYISNKDNLITIKTDNYPEFADLWKLNEYNLLYNINNYYDEMIELFKNINITKESKILDTCVGPGFFIKELLENEYNVSTMDKSRKNVELFYKDLKKIGINHHVKNCTWLNMKKYYKDNSFDLLLNRGNSIIFANGGLMEEIKIDRHKTLKVLRKTLKIYYDLLKKGGYLYIDKYKDSEVPAEKIAAKLHILSTKEKKNLVFKVERRPEKKYRYASMILRDDSHEDENVFNRVYDLTENELEDSLKSVGFKIKKLKLKSERHFVVWLAQK